MKQENKKCKPKNTTKKMQNRAKFRAPHSISNVVMIQLDAI